jgi:hypothetical protein
MTEYERIIMESEGELSLAFITNDSTVRKMRARLASTARGDSFDSVIRADRPLVTLVDIEKAAPRSVRLDRLLWVRGSAGEWRHELLPGPACDGVGVD